VRAPAKSSSVCFPIVLFAWLLWIQRRPVREALLRSASYAAVAIAVSVVVIAVWRDHGMIVHRAASPPVEVATTLVAYSQHVLWPVDLSPVYPLQSQHPLVAVVVCALAAIALGVSWRWLPARARFTAVAVSGALLPVSNLVPMTLRLSTAICSSCWRCWCCRSRLRSTGSPREPRPGCPRRHRRRADVLVAAGLEASASARLARTWQSSRTLWAHANRGPAGRVPRPPQARRGARAERQWPAALAQLRAAQELNPGNPLPDQRLLHLDATVAESRGTLAPGMAARWWTDSERAVVDRGAYQRLVADVDGTSCCRAATRSRSWASTRGRSPMTSSVGGAASARSAHAGARADLSRPGPRSNAPRARIAPATRIGAGSGGWSLAGPRAREVTSGLARIHHTADCSGGRAKHGAARWADPALRLGRRHPRDRRPRLTDDARCDGHQLVVLTRPSAGWPFPCRPRVACLREDGSR